MRPGCWRLFADVMVATASRSPGSPRGRGRCANQGSPAASAIPVKKEKENERNCGRVSRFCYASPPTPPAIKNASNTHGNERPRVSSLSLHQRNPLGSFQQPLIFRWLLELFSRSNCENLSARKPTSRSLQFFHPNFPLFLRRSEACFASTRLDSPSRSGEIFAGVRLENDRQEERTRTRALE